MSASLLAMTVATDDVADALAAAGQAFMHGAHGDLRGWDLPVPSQGATRAAPSAAHRPGERRRVC